MQWFHRWFPFFEIPRARSGRVISLLFSPKAAQLLDTLCKLTESTPVEVFKNALKLYYALVMRVAEGDRLFVLRDGKFVALEDMEIEEKKSHVTKSPAILKLVVDNTDSDI